MIGLKVGFGNKLKLQAYKNNTNRERSSMKFILDEL